ncbi:Oxoglutarate/iron-dependent dioxygenase [uncultured Caudovirales phage]|uniref:procollagen-proline 3-dioxygenase n=1 Tax=uncultured Caudovirales phage TaxID=2100421 RepID=A0A6J5NZ31_9CAUD|nr:Oxoglutarate/iron-dependent dioxygenase [uncultured Caudovirales phage]CAB4156772.1 Oxoglutarate/iron-dependent dioxygenase [uncultured Caudovirales phage]CAB4160047.1 Oxoglutarate/iron-dependent dioxygenase [uncultured Caudovirales phage]CAB4164910.1 Oxoglutarate/iron-dependent dioxygenase [uncultured Caudovirales phage]CAB4172252.1 Oxoglutarate/iron-dependent dioxygenase [uncultured Caudovirales phage]
MDSDTKYLTMDGVHVIPNFIGKESLDELKPLLLNGLDNWYLHLEKAENKTLSAMEIAKIKQNKATYGNNILKLDHSEKSGNKDLYDAVAKYMANDKHEIEHLFGEIQPEDKFGITVMLTGSLITPHTDEQVFPQGLRTVNKMTLRDITSVCYLNDDYEGGELCFDLLGIKIKPKAGTLVFFPTPKRYKHCVTTVTNGQRFSVSKFWNFKSS